MLGTVDMTQFYFKNNRKYYTISALPATYVASATSTKETKQKRSAIYRRHKYTLVIGNYENYISKIIKLLEINAIVSTATSQ